jgi:hypothetical protein
MTTTTTTEALPTTFGWYTYDGDVNHTLIFLLNDNGDWYAVTASGEMAKCDVGYITQGGSLRLMQAFGGDPESHVSGTGGDL